MTTPPAHERPEEMARLIAALDASDRFRRDGRVSGIFHPGRIAFRELSPRDSLHIVIKGGHVSAHIDDVCPLRCRADGTIRFSWGLVLAHNVAMMAADVGRRIRGLHGSQRCNLGCEMVWVEDEAIAAALTKLDEPESSAPGHGTECQA